MLLDFLISVNVKKTVAIIFIAIIDVFSTSHITFIGGMFVKLMIQKSRQFVAKKIGKITSNFMLIKTLKCLNFTT